MHMMLGPTREAIAQGRDGRKPETGEQPAVEAPAEAPAAEAPAAEAATEASSGDEPAAAA